MPKRVKASYHILMSTDDRRKTRRTLKSTSFFPWKWLDKICVRCIKSYLFTNQSANESKLHENEKTLTNDDLVPLKLFQISPFTSLSYLKAPQGSCAYNEFTHFRHNHILGINTRRPGGVLYWEFTIYTFSSFSPQLHDTSLISDAFSIRYGISAIMPHIGV